MTRALGAYIAVLLLGAAAFFALAPLHDLEGDFAAQRELIGQQLELQRDQHRLMARSVRVQRAAVRIGRALRADSGKSVESTDDVATHSREIKTLVAQLSAQLNELLTVTYDVQHHVQEIDRKTE